MVDRKSERADYRHEIYSCRADVVEMVYRHQKRIGVFLLVVLVVAMGELERGEDQIRCRRFRRRRFRGRVRARPS
jgi:hypothetical protein